jgi:hypothetical protein
MIQELEKSHWFPVGVQEIVDHHNTCGDHHKSQHYQDAACEKECGLV